jgi:hypothetical protein
LSLRHPRYCGVGVGRGNWRLHCWEHTPCRKIRHRFQECKHTLLTLLAVCYVLCVGGESMKRS